MENRKSRKAKRSKRNRARAKAEVTKLRCLHSRRRHIELVRRFETKYQVGMTAGEVPESMIKEEILDFDTSLLE